MNPEVKMTWYRFLSLIAASIGFMGAVFIRKSLLYLTPERMLSQTTAESLIKYSPNQIKAITSQKAHAVSGATAIFIAFLIQCVTLILIDEKIVFWKGHVVFIFISWVLILLVLWCMLTCITESLDQRYKRSVIASKLGSIFKARKVTEEDAGVIKGMAQDLLGLDRYPQESTEEFIKRIAKFVGQPAITGIDLSEVRDN